MVFVEHLVLYTIRNPMECVFTLCVVFTPSTKLHVLFLRAVKVSNSHHLYCVEGQDYLKEFAISKILVSTWTEHAHHPPHTPPPPNLGASECESASPPLPEKNYNMFVGARASTLLNCHPNQNLGIERVCFVLGRKDIQNAPVRQ